MNAYAIFAVNEHLEYLLEEGARNQSARIDKPSLRARIAGAIEKVRDSVATTTYDMTSIFPKLDDYPYRG